MSSRRSKTASPPAHAAGRAKARPLSAARGPARDRLGRLVRRFAGARVLVVGDLMLDRFVRGEVWRISPEAPVPVVQVRSEDVHPGGAGNVVANLASLGARPAVVGWIGRDAAGSELRALLAGLGVPYVLPIALGILAVLSVVTVVQRIVVVRRQLKAPREAAE